MMRRILSRAAVSVICLAVFGCEGDGPGGTVILPCDVEPVVLIVNPPVPEDYLDTFYPRAVEFVWEAPDDCQPSFIRYLVMRIENADGEYDPDYDIIGELNADPSRFEPMWSDWIPYFGSSDQGISVRLDEELTINFKHLFAVQAMDAEGDVTVHFEENLNARIFSPSSKIAGPFIEIYEENFFPCLVSGRVPRRNIQVPEKFPLNFRWIVDASWYGSTVEGIRYSWDGMESDAPFEMVTSAPEMIFGVGSHTLTVEAIDDLGFISRVTLGLEVVDVTMERDLLWVDDFLGSDDPDPARVYPMESEHDQFWLDICSRATGFDPQTDVYDVVETGVHGILDLERICRYRNVIWTYSSSQYAAWWHMFDNSNLALFMAMGGHIWILGRPDTPWSGLTAAIHETVQLPVEMEYIPYYARYCSFLEGQSACIPYKDFGVTVVDKVIGSFRGDIPVIRRIESDAMAYAFRDGADPVTLLFPELPDRLDLWEEVTCEWCFFNPMERGFTFIEAYDPGYYMDFAALVSQEGFHPMYRIRTRNTLSPLNSSTVAFWITKYEDVLPRVGSGRAVAAPSVHMGFPLWYFDRAQVDSLADAIFDCWGFGIHPVD